MVRKMVVWALVALMTLTGCSTVQKKFTRKKKEKRAQSVIYLEEQKYQKKYSNEYYYKTHYTYWKTWHDDLLMQLGGNQKKLRRCAQETLNHLTEMHRYLNPEKQAELQPLLDEMSQITQKIESGSVSQANAIRPDLERIKRLVANDFYYDKVKESLLPDQVDLNESSVGAATP